MAISCVKLDRGLHVIHLFYRIDRAKWLGLAESERVAAREELERLCKTNNHPCAPRITTYANVGGKADLVFFILARELAEAGSLHQQAAGCFPPGVLQSIFTYFSVTELSEYTTSDEENQQMLMRDEKLELGSEAFNKRIDEIRTRMAQYEHYRLYPELPEWEVMAFYPMTKKREGADNWYSLSFDARKKLMGGHARVGRKYGGRISQLITGSTGLDDWEWGVTLMAHQVDAIKEIVYEMRFDDVTARYGDFGPFFVNLRLQPSDLWEYLRL